MKYLIIPGLPAAALFVSHQLGAQLSMRAACIISFLLTFAAAYIALHFLHILIFGHKPRFFR